MIRKIRVEDAVGTVLAHDMTRIERGKFKGVGFKKGHVIGASDIEGLRKIGKQSVYVLNLHRDHLHEDDAAARIAAAVSGEGLEFTEPSEGKINIRSTCEGLLKINTEALLQVNRLEAVIVATLKNNYPCKKGETVAATRIIPLVIPEKRILALEALTWGRGPVVSIKPFRRLNVGAVVTGSEVYEGMITDDFGPSVGKKITDAGCTLVEKLVVPDDAEVISKAVSRLDQAGCDLIITTGGLSVDPDDVTPQGVAQSGAETVFYGSPVLPGAMLMVSRLGNTPVVSLPACVFYYNRTVFDLIFPRLLAGENIEADDIAAMGHGGLCMNCDVCHYPACSFGR